MKIIAISDTHCQHRQVKLPEGDMIIHAGDISNEGKEGEVMNFLIWFSKLDYKYKIFIAGNHDFFFDGETDKDLSRIIPEGIIYLNDSGITIEGIRIWGSPITPWLYDTAFNRNPGKNIAKHWKKIPPDTNILITHGPPYGILDKNRAQFSAGCKSLKRAVRKIAPVLHIFGHIHESYGQMQKGSTTYINACIVEQDIIIKNDTIVYQYTIIQDDPIVYNYQQETDSPKPELL